MTKQTLIASSSSRAMLLTALLSGMVIVALAAVSVMALDGVKKSERPSGTTRPVMSEAPTPSVTSSLTNGVYVQDPQTKKYTRVSPYTGLIASPASPLSGQRPTSLTRGSANMTGYQLYVDPSLHTQGRQDRIASQATGIWFGGWNADVAGDVNRVVSSAAANGTVPILVAYNIPNRDCGSFSAGGLNNSASYRDWIQSFANGIARNKAIVILEPDALPGLDCLSESNQSQRLSDIAFAVSVLSRTGSITYLDAGNYSWQPVSVMTQRLKAANVMAARGFSLNVSGYGWTDKSVAYGKQLIAAGAGSGFIVDTSRNGQGPAAGNEWCNPRGRGLGKSPSTNTGVAGLDAYLWVKVPGESDGTCGGGPSAGQWWDEIADELIRNANQ